MKLHLQSDRGVTLVENEFIDRYMSGANGEFVKLYLYLLRCAGTGRDLSISSIADFFDQTENDVKRGLMYWEKTGLLTLKTGSQGEILEADFCSPENKSSSGQAGYGANVPASGMQMHTGDGAHRSSGGHGTGYPPASVHGSVHPAHTGAGAANAGAGVNGSSAGTFAGNKAEGGIPSKSELSIGRISDLQGNAQVKQMLFVCQSYLKAPMNPTMTSSLLYYYDVLGFSEDLVEYLVEYCAAKGNDNIRYMEKVAQEWYKEGVQTVSEAKSSSGRFTRAYYDVLRALGITNRGPATSEKEYLDRWLNEYGFSLELITEACSRTILQIHQPNFAYAEGILKRWQEAGVHTTEDVKALDQQHNALAAAAAASSYNNQQAQPAQSGRPKANRFNNFPQREYDWNDLERQLSSVGQE